MKTANAILKALLAGNAYALQFNGSNQSVSFGAPASLTTGMTGDITLEAWVVLTVDNTAAFNGPISGRSSEVAQSYDMCITVNGMLTEVNGAGGWQTLSVSKANLFPLGAVKHAVITRSGTTVTFYVDGVQIGTPQVITVGALNAGTGPLIGEVFYGGAHYFNGQVDNVSFYNRALSAAEVAQHFLCIYRNENGLVGRWKFDEGSGSTAYDQSGLGNNGTLTNGPTYVAGISRTKSRQLVQADLYTFTLVGGTVARYSGGDQPVTIGGVTWSLGPLFDRGKTKVQLGLQVPSLDLLVTPNASDTIGGILWSQALSNGALDGARVLVERFISDSWSNTSVGKLYQFNGKVSQIDGDRLSAKLTVVADTILLNQKMPRNLYQATCLHTLYDAGCNLSVGAFTVIGSVGNGSTSSVITSNLAQADNYFDLGVIQFTSGAAAGARRTIKSYAHASGAVTVTVPLPAVPAFGDTFTIYPGCNKVYNGDCVNKFANQINFRGFPFIPPPDTSGMQP